MIRTLLLATIALASCTETGTRFEGAILTMDPADSGRFGGVLLEAWPVLHGPPQIVFTLDFTCRSKSDCAKLVRGERVTLSCTGSKRNAYEHTGTLTGCVPR